MSVDISFLTVHQFVVVGGGIGGLSLALYLQKNGFDAVIFERDSDFDSRKQGYSLTIQLNGFKALEQMGVSSQVRQASHCEINGTTTLRSDGNVLFETRKKKNKKFRNFPIPRQSLRRILLEHLRPKSVYWSKEVHTFEEDIKSEKPLVTVYFNDGSIVKCEALIGCDGVHSKIRKQIVGDDLNYLGVWSINGISLHNSHPLALNSVFQTLDGHSRLFVKPFEPGKSMWQLTFPSPLQMQKNDSEKEGTSDCKTSLSKPTNDQDYVFLLEKAKTLVQNWHEPVPQLVFTTKITDMRGGPVFDRTPLDKLCLCKPDQALPFPSSSCHYHFPPRHITLLGDSCHPMSPFKGQGANQALCDVISLVDTLIFNKKKEEENKQSGVDNPFDYLSKSFSEFESEMLSRSKKYVLSSRSSVEFLHTPEALNLEKLVSFVNDRSESKS